MSSDLERRLERALSAVNEPPAGVEARLRAAALAALPPAAGARRRLAPRTWRRRAGPLVIVAVLLVAGGALAASLFSWNAGSTGRRGVFVSDSAAQRFAATPALAGAPWLSDGAAQTVHELPPRPSLVFPPGIGYARALQLFYDAASARGELPAGAHLGKPLPAGTVVSLPARRGDELRLDLRAPFGYLVPSGVVLGPRYVVGTRSVTFPPAGEPGTPLPVGVSTVAPALLPCQTMHGDTAGPGCPQSALPPGARYATGAATVPALVGERLPRALARMQAAHLGLFADVGYLPALSEGALTTAARWSGPRAEDSLIGVSEFVRSGYGAPEFLRPGGRAGVRLPDTETRPPGTVIAQYPPSGTLVPRGTPAVVAVADDDCLLSRLPAGPWDCVPGSAAARLREPALTGALPWLSRHDDQLFRLSQTRERPSLEFPPGTDYLEALRALLVSVVERGRLPEQAVVGPPLRSGVVLVPASGTRGLRLDLRAPFGYDPATGQIAQPTTASLRGAPAPQLRRAIREGRAALLPATFAGDYLTRPSLSRCLRTPGGLRGTGCRVG